MKNSLRRLIVLCISLGGVTFGAAGCGYLLAGGIGAGAGYAAGRSQESDIGDDD